MQRLTDIPAEVTLINPGYELVNLAGLATIEGRKLNHPPVEGMINLSKYPEAARARLWQSIKNCIFGKVLIEKNPTSATDKDPVEGAENNQHSYSGPTTVEKTLRNEALKEVPVRQDDFSKVQGITPLVAQRLKSLGFRTYEQFLNTDEKVLLKIEGLDRTNLDVISAAMAMLLPVPDPASINPALPPVQFESDVETLPDGSLLRTV